jgi:SAM-dependent methyltransferase
LDGDLPVLVPAPGAYLAEQLLGLERDRAALVDEAKEAERYANSAPELAKDFLRQKKGLEENERLLAALAEWLLPHASPRELARAAPRAFRDRGGSDGGYVSSSLFQYLRRDWGGEPLSEAEVGALAGAAAAPAPHAPSGAGPVLVLGAGTGRVAEELARRGEDVVALDNSLAMVGAYRLLSRGPLRFHLMGRRNRRSSSDFVVEVTARRPGPPPPSLKWVMADASRAPFVDGSFAYVVSVYFGDVVRPSQWIPEVHRLLSQGGQLIHVGPLGYHFTEESEKLSADQLAERLMAHGFAVTSVDWLKSTHLAFPEAMFTSNVENLVLRAQKAASPRRARWDERTVLSLSGQAVLHSSVRVSDVSRDFLSCTVEVGGESVALAAAPARFLELVDGASSVEELLFQLAESFGARAVGERERAQVSAAVDQLIAMGALRAR